MTSVPENPVGESAKNGKVYLSALSALEGIADGMTVLVAGFAGCGIPQELLRGLSEAGASRLTLICQGTWTQDPGDFTIGDLVASGQVKKIISPMPFHPVQGGPVKDAWESGNLELEIVSQGVLAERLRAGGAGIGGVFIPSGSRTRFAEGKEVRQYDGREHVLELGLKADFALLRAQAADTLGNLVYESTNRNWNPTMAMAAAITVVEVNSVHEPGGLDPELVITQSIFIDRLVLSASS